MASDPLPAAAYAPPTRPRKADDPEGTPEVVQLWDEDTIVLHAELIARMREEQKPADALTEMLVERTAATYVRLKRKDASGWENDRASREAHATFLDMLRELKKQSPTFDPTAEMAQRLASAVVEATADLPPELRNQVREKLADDLSAVLS